MIPARTLPLAILVCACNRSEPAPDAAPVAVAPVVEAKAAEAKAAEAKTPEAKAPEAKAPDAKADAKAPEATPTVVADPASDVLRSASPRGDSLLEVQVVDLTAEEEKAIDALLAEGAEIAADDARMPERWRIGRPFHFWFGDTPQIVTLRGFESGSGGSGTIYTMTLDAKGVREKGGWVTDVGTTIADAKGKGDDPAAAARVIPALRKQLKAAGLRGRPTAKNVAAVRGAFPAPHTTAIAVSIDTGGSDPTGGYSSGLILTDDAGNITGAAYDLDDRLDSFEIGQLLDLGADGIDELVFTTSYYEGNYTHLLRWNGATPETVVIEGDGA